MARHGAVGGHGHVWSSPPTPGHRTVRRLLALLLGEVVVVVVLVLGVVM